MMTFYLCMTTFCIVVQSRLEFLLLIKFFLFDTLFSKKRKTIKNISENSKLPLTWFSENQISPTTKNKLGNFWLIDTINCIFLVKYIITLNVLNIICCKFIYIIFLKMIKILLFKKKIKYFLSTSIFIKIFSIHQ